MDNLRTRYKNTQARLAKMKGSYKAVATIIGRSKSWVSMFANNQLDDVGILLIADIEDAMNSIQSNNNKQPATHTPADSCSPDFSAMESGACTFQDSATSGLVEMDCSARGNNESLMEG